MGYLAFWIEPSSDKVRDKRIEWSNKTFYEVTRILQEEIGLPWVGKIESIEDKENE